MNIVLYTIDCPSCIVLEKKLASKNIEFLRVSDKNIFAEKGLGSSFFPILEVDGELMEYKKAVEWVNGI